MPSSKLKKRKRKKRFGYSILPFALAKAFAEILRMSVDGNKTRTSKPEIIDVPYEDVTDQKKIGNNG